MKKNKTCKRCNVLGLACRRHQYSVQAMFRAWHDAYEWKNKQEEESYLYFWKLVQRDGWYVVEGLKKNGS